MDSTKKLLRNLPEHLLYFMAADLISALIALIVNLVIRPLLIELARGDAEQEKLIDRWLWLFFALLFYIVMAVLLYKSSSLKNRFLAETIDRPYRFGQDLVSFVKSGLPTGVAAYLLFSLPLTVLLAIVPDLPYLPALFYPQYALIELLGSAFGAWAAGAAVYALFSVIWFPILHAIWEKNRIYGK